MREIRNNCLVVLAAMSVVGCHEPHFMTQVDYATYNAVGSDLDYSENADEFLPTEPPRTVLDPAPAEQWELSLEEVKRIALENNKQIALSRYQPGEAGTDIELRLSSFDANFEMGAAWRRTDQQRRTTLFDSSPISTDDQFGAAVGGVSRNTTSGGIAENPATGSPRLGGAPGDNIFSLSKRNAAGGFSSISYGLDYNFNAPNLIGLTPNPSWNSIVEFEIEQPLLQGAGVEFNRSPILIARANHEQAIMDFETIVRTLLRDTELSYWQLYFTYQDLYSRELGLKQALSTWQIEKIKEGISAGSYPAVAQTREQYEFFRVERLEALRRVLEQERELRRLLGLAPDDGHQIVPKDDPTIAAFTPDWSIGVGEAMDLRPELRGQRFLIRAAELNLFQQRNGLKPDLTIAAVWNISGLDNQFDQSIDRLTDNRFTDWALGIRYRRPIGERAAHAAVRNAQLALSRERKTLRNLEHETIHQMHTAYQDLISSFKLIQLQEDRRLAATAQLKALEEYYRLGKTTIDVLLQVQTTFVGALRAESEATIRYNQALVEWEFAKGTILTNDNVVMAEEQYLDRNDCALWKCNRQWASAKPLKLKPGKIVHGQLAPPDDSGPLYPDLPRKKSPTETEELGATNPPSASEEFNTTSESRVSSVEAANTPIFTTAPLKPDQDQLQSAHSEEEQSSKDEFESVSESFFLPLLAPPAKELESVD